MWLIFAILAAITAALAVIFSKAGLKNIDPNVGFALQAILILIISWSAVWFQKAAANFGKIDKRTWIFIACAGAATCFSSLFQFKALKDGPAGAVTSIERSSLVLTVILAFFFLKEKITWQLAVGALMIIGGAVLIAVAQGNSK